MDDRHEQYRNLAQAKREADDYHYPYPVILSPEIERLTRFIWWAVGGVLIATVAVTLWVAGIQNKVADTAARVTTIENSRVELIKQHQEMWFMKTHGISNRDAFFQEHGFQAPPSLSEQQQNNPK